MKVVSPSIYSIHRNRDSEKSLRGSILLAEDNKTNQEVAQAMLHRFGCQVDIVEDGVAALRELSRKSYDLVLMDCQMPLKDGLVATSELRDLEKRKNLVQRIPAIALTANALQGDREMCLTTGIDDYLTKPFSAQQLYEILQHWLSKKTS